MRQSSKSALVHVASHVFNTPLAIVPEKLHVILQAVGMRLTGDPQSTSLSSVLDSGLLQSRTVGANNLVLAWQDADSDDDDDGTGVRPDRRGSSQSRRPYSITENGTAIIPVTGSLMESGGWMSALSGCSSYESIGAAVKTAQEEDDEVRGILLKIDSPGGTTHGCFQLSDLVHSYRKGGKPIFAIAKNQACSAAYAIGSGAKKLWVTLTGGVGSIGVFALLCNQAGADEQAGVEYEYISYGAKKTDGNPHQALSKSARKDIQSEVDRQGDIFVTKMARNRKVDFEEIRATQAGVLFADRAIPLLADKMGTYEECLGALEDLTSKLSAVSATIPMRMEDEEAANINSEATAPTSSQGDSVVSETKVETPVVPTSAAPLDPVIAAAISAAVATAIKAEKDCDPEKMESKGKKGDDMKSSKKPMDPDDDEKSEPDDDEDDKKSKKGKKATVSEISVAASTTEFPGFDAAETAELCMIAGMDQFTGKLIREKKTVAEVRKFLQDKRAALSSDPASVTTTSHAGASAGQNPVDQAVQQANQLAAQSGGKLSRSQALLQILSANPRIYDDYEDQREHVIKHGTNREMREYVAGTAVRQAQSLGLSATIGAELPDAIRM